MMNKQSKLTSIFSICAIILAVCLAAASAPAQVTAPSQVSSQAPTVVPPAEAAGPLPSGSKNPAVINASEQPINIQGYSIKIAYNGLVDIGYNPFGGSTTIALNFTLAEETGKLNELISLGLIITDSQGSWINNSFSESGTGANGQQYLAYNIFAAEETGNYFLRFPTGEMIDLTQLLPATTLGVDSKLTENRIPLIFDDDGSRDGTVALLYLLNIPEVSIKAITISYGEAHPDIYAQHTGRMLDFLGVQGIPLGAGQDIPLGEGIAFPDWLRQASNNFWDFSLPKMGEAIPVQDAPELMVSTINQSSEPVTIFLSGTFTNLAQALRLDPSITKNIKAVYFMGGAVKVPGNITNLLPDSQNKVAEWNIIADPQAAKEVFESGLDLYMVPLDATGKVLLEKTDITPWHQGDGKAELAADLYDIMFDAYGFKQAEIFDLTAAVLLAKPDLCEFEPYHLDVVIESGNTFGQTKILPNSEPNVRVCLEPESDLIIQELNDRFSGTGSNEPDQTPSISPIIGTWKGSVLNKDFKMNITVTIKDTCQLNQICGGFDISTVSCSGKFTWIGMDQDMFKFQASDLTKACGKGEDFLSPQEDGTLLYISRGDYGETKGILKKSP